MNVIIISNEHNFLHISNDCEHIDYTFYNYQGKLVDGGVLDEIIEDNEIDKISKKIIQSFNNLITFTEPYTKLERTKADNLLEILEEQEYINSQDKVSNYLKI